ncbi:membrane integrity-associated transporter subunit PqiC [Pantoea sp. Aalb]|uniref:membrane integrity-associated transporter subunit PqiC n=1 Tax=Pantoea sp. Aalb TaxID=2576762 RepID=UPI001326088A|nr:membrane integrity-associated transporter subunit PqiC [Pantoea sp. Aalb]MXP67482.1 membrane integrity-associated transporter subunit PqiC [Pantoea sp. Aalb]
MKWFIIGAVLALTGCGSDFTENKYYQIPAGNKLELARTHQYSCNHPVIWVEKVNLSDYLLGNGLVYQISKVKYNAATNNLWASPLDTQLKETLIHNLTKKIPGGLITSEPLCKNYYNLIVYLRDFHGRFDGQVVISGEWLLRHKTNLIKNNFNITIPQTQDNYSSLVEALSIGWDIISKQIANNIIKNNNINNKNIF